MRYQRNKKRRSLNRVIGIVLFLCFMAAAAYFLFFSPLFQIKEIKVSEGEFLAAAEKIAQENLQEKKFGLLSQQNLFFVPVDKIKAAILNLSPEIKSAIVDKKTPDGLEVKIEKYQDIGVWCWVEDKIVKDENKDESVDKTIEIATSSPAIVKREVKKCFRIDREGVIYKNSPLISGSLILNIYDGRRRDSEPKTKDNVLSGSMASFVIQIRTALSEELKINVDNFEIISSEDLMAKTGEGWSIYLNSAYSAESQIEALRIILNELVKEKRQSLEYIDLRIEGRAYYR